MNIFFLKISCITLFCWSAICLAQSYSFDYEITSMREQIKSPTDRSWFFGDSVPAKRYINSKVPGISLSIYKVYGKEGHEALLYDDNRKILHNFEVKQGRNDKHPDLHYLRSNRFKYPKKVGAFDGKVHVRKIKHNVYEIIAEVTDNKYNLYLNIEESDDDLTHDLLSFDGASNLTKKMISSLKVNLDPEKNYFFKEYVKQYVPGSTFHVVNEAVKTEFTVTLPDTKRTRKLMSKFKD